MLSLCDNDSHIQHNDRYAGVEVNMAITYVNGDSGKYMACSWESGLGWKTKTNQMELPGAAVDSD